MPSKAIALIGLILLAPLGARAEEPVRIAAPPEFNRKAEVVPLERWAFDTDGSCRKLTTPTLLCGVGMVCLRGCAHPGTSVGLLVEGRLLTTTVTLEDGGWFAEFPIEELERGRILEARDVGHDTLVLRESSWNTVWGLSIEAGLASLPRYGAVGMFVAVTPRLHPVARAQWFGIHLRYNAAQVSDQAMHRLALGFDFDPFTAHFERHNRDREYHGARLLLSVAVGGAFMSQTSGSAIVAGPTVGVSLQVLVPVARHVSVVVRTSIEGFLQAKNSFAMWDVASLGVQADF